MEESRPVFEGRNEFANSIGCYRNPFRRFALEGGSAARVAGELGLSENAVLQAKSRILKRLRTEAGDLLN